MRQITITMSKTSIFLVLTMFLLLTQFSFVQSDTSLIYKTCKHTPNYNLCVKALISDPRSSKADTAGLALILVDVIKAKATFSLNFIKQQIPKSPLQQKKLLLACAHMFNTVITADIPEAIEALQKGDPKFAEDGVNDAGNEAISCEASFHGKSPMTHLNNDVHDHSVVASAIVRMLL